MGGVPCMLALCSFIPHCPIILVVVVVSVVVFVDSFVVGVCQVVRTGGAAGRNTD